MNLFRLALRQLAQAPLQFATNSLIMGLGLAMVVLLLQAQQQFQDRMQRDAAGINLVVGAQGSPMQLILSSVYHLDVPTGNVPWQARETIEQDPAVAWTIPLALGDNHAGYRIVGTEASYIEHYHGQLAAGTLFEHSMQAVLGAEVARHTGLNVADTFTGHHGLGTGGGAHGDHPYTVTGLLAHTGSIIDRLILVSVDSVWRVHAGHDHGGHAHGHPQGHGHQGDDGRHHDEHDHDHGHNHHHDHDQHEHHHEDHDADHGHSNQPEEQGDLTAILVGYASPMASTRLPRLINQQTPWLAAEPAYHSVRLFSMLSPLLDGLRLFGKLLIACSLLGIFVLLFQNLRQRRYDVAVLRSMGAGRATVFAWIMLEGLLMVATGLALGLLIGHAALAAAGLWLAEGRAIGLTGLAWASGQGPLLLGVLLAGTLIAALPAWLAARTEVANTLRKG